MKNFLIVVTITQTTNYLKKSSLRRTQTFMLKEKLQILVKITKQNIHYPKKMKQKTLRI